MDNKSSPGALYDISKDFVANWTSGPSFSGKVFLQGERTAKDVLFGHPIVSKVGIPACAIMSSKGIKLASSLGFDVLTYKTIRSRPKKAHPLPNIVYLEEGQKVLLEGQRGCFSTERPPEKLEDISIANSVGIASFELEEMHQDIKEARNSLTTGQVLIASFFGTDQEARTQEEDFAFLAESVAQTGAHIVEANFSCPNDFSSSHLIYKDPHMVYSIAKAICRSVPGVPVIIKVGIFDSPVQMKEVLVAAAKAGVSGICGINSIPKEIINRNGRPSFGSDRRVAGVSGSIIRDIALQFVIESKKINDEESLGLEILATGGITKPEHFDLFIESGAKIALSATGAIWNPLLAIEYHNMSNSIFNKK